jgi:Zinc-binding dehydrogenase
MLIDEDLRDHATTGDPCSLDNDRGTKMKALTYQGITKKIHEKHLNLESPETAAASSKINEAAFFHTNRRHAGARIVDIVTPGAASTLLDRISAPNIGAYETLAILSNILPASFQYGMFDGKVLTGSALAIIGAGPIGLAVLLIAQFYGPAQIIMIDVDDNRLEMAARFGATEVFNSTGKNALKWVMRVTEECGVGIVVETVRWLARYELCQKMVAANGLIVRTWTRPVANKTVFG